MKKKFDDKALNKKLDIAWQKPVEDVVDDLLENILSDENVGKRYILSEKAVLNKNCLVRVVKGGNGCYLEYFELFKMSVFPVLSKDGWAYFYDKDLFKWRLCEISHFNKSEGLKFSKGKLRWHLLPWEQLEKVAWIFDHRAVRHGEFNWKNVKNSKVEYYNAAMGHIFEWLKGNKFNEEDWNSEHLAQAIWNLIVLMWFDENTGKIKE